MNLEEMPVLLLTGYLGSGKTTLVNHILSNRKGIRFAVIVNDIGEVNIDASLIQKGGVVAQKDDSLVALQNGCICCTLKADLIQQLDELMASGKFDYIVIEASGICEPEPIAQTICSIPALGPSYAVHGVPRLDCIVTVVDALRMQSEFGCGDDLKKDNIDEEDIENLVIQQIEFCNIILLNKVSEVAPAELERIRRIVRELNPGAEIIEADFADVDLDLLLNTWRFSYRSTEGMRNKATTGTMTATMTGTESAGTITMMITKSTKSMKSTDIITGTMNIITTIITMRGRPRNTVSAHSCISAVRPSISTSSTGSSPKSCRRM